MNKIYLILVLFLIIWFALFHNWFVIILDTSFVPLNSVNFDFLWKWFLEIFLEICNYILGYWFYSKLLFFCTILFYWIFWLQLGKYISNNWIQDDLFKKIAPTLTMLFFLINPFIYERAISQVWVASWYLLLFYWILFFLKYISNQKSKQLFLSALFFGLSINLMLQAFFFVWLFVVIFRIFFYKKFNNIFKNIIIFWLIIIWLNINFLWSFFIKSDTNYRVKTLQSLNQENINAFKVNSLNWLSAEITSWLLYWFWWEKYYHIALPQTFNKNRFVAWIIIVLISLYGLVYLTLNKSTKPYWISLLIIGIISWMLWIGIASNHWWEFVQALYDHIPFYIWLRESHKWIWMLMFVYWSGFCIGIYLIYKMFVSKYKILANTNYWIILSCLLLFAWTPWLTNSFKWQLFVANYPNEYFIAKEKLLSQEKSKIVIFPWHSYIACDWTKWRIISNPINWLFSPLETIISDNIEMWELYSNYDNPVSKDIESFISNKWNIQILKNNWIWYIVNLKTCADFQTYYFLNKTNWLNSIYNSDKIEVFSIK